jgi:peroxiredoxin
MTVMGAGLIVAATNLFRDTPVQALSAASAASFEQISVPSPLVGKPAPDFTLADPFGKLVTLKDLRGETGRPVVLFMSGGGACGTCLAQIAQLNMSSLFTDGSVGIAAVVSAQTDPPSAWQSFIGDNPEFEKVAVLIDQDGAAIKAYGAGQLPSGLGHGGGYVPGHSYFVIDRDGIVRLVADDQTMGDWTEKLETYVEQL